MDKNVTPNTRSTVSEHDWKTELDALNTTWLKNGFLSGYTLNLPFGYRRLTYQQSLKFFGRVGIGYQAEDNTPKNNRPKEVDNNLPHILTVSDYQTLLTIPSVYLTKLRTKTYKGRRYISLQQDFPATVISTRIKRKPGFYYKWDEKIVTVSKNIGTLNPKKIQEQVESLLTESMRFLLIYCTA
ncbi:MAG: hypothetical protein H8E12_07775 [Rhodobacteraceae bacterium]|nr:hypothetical protein [Paracoccaceae bacterium]